MPTAGTASRFSTRSAKPRGLRRSVRHSPTFGDAQLIDGNDEPDALLIGPGLKIEVRFADQRFMAFEPSARTRRKAMTAAAKLLEPGVAIREIGFGRAQGRWSTATIVTVSLFGAAFVVALL